MNVKQKIVVHIETLDNLLVQFNGRNIPLNSGLAELLVAKSQALQALATIEAAEMTVKRG